MSSEDLPLARPSIGSAEEQRVLAVLRSGQLSLGPLLGRVRARVRVVRRRRVRQRGVERHRRTAPGAAGGRSKRRRRGDHLAVLVRRERQRCPVRAGAAGVRRHRSGHLELGRRRGGGRGQHPDRSAAAGPRLRLPGRHRRVRAARRCRSSRMPARRSAPSTRTVERSEAADTRRCSGSIRTSSSRPGREGWS